MSEWRDICTAPKDGTIFDVWLGDAEPLDLEFYSVPGSRRSANWHFYEGKFRPYAGLTNLPTFVCPTHWMPLPPEPKP